METVHSVELRHQGQAAGGLEEEEGVSGGRSQGWLCVRSRTEHFCVNISRQFVNDRNGEIFVQLSHSSHLLSTAGGLFSLYLGTIQRCSNSTRMHTLVLLWMQVCLPAAELRRGGCRMMFDCRSWQSCRWDLKTLKLSFTETELAFSGSTSPGSSTKSEPCRGKDCSARFKPELITRCTTLFLLPQNASN